MYSPRDSGTTSPLITTPTTSSTSYATTSPDGIRSSFAFAGPQPRLLNHYLPYHPSYHQNNINLSSAPSAPESNHSARPASLFPFANPPRAQTQYQQHSNANQQPTAPSPTYVSPVASGAASPVLAAMGSTGTSSSVSSGLPSNIASTAVAGTCVSQVELTIKCTNLVDKDVFSKSDPMVIISMANNGHWVEKGRTEVIHNCLNPEFCRRINLEYYFEEVQKLKFDVYDIDNDTATLDDDDYLGQMECSLGQIVSSSPYTKPLLNHKGSPMGSSSITVYAEEVDVNTREILMFSFKAQRLEDKNFFSKSNPFLEVHKAGPDNKWLMVHRTEVIFSNLNPVWKRFEVRQQTLGGQNVEAKCLVMCYNHRSNGKHDYIGESVVTLRELLEAQQTPKSWPCVNVQKQKQKRAKYKDSGTIILSNCKVTVAHSFLDYVFGGTQINFTVAIDFTASNGDPRSPKSLHYIHPSQPNEYTTAIWAVGEVIQDYDSDKMFPALGFGARIPPRYEVSHEFALNFDMSNPYCSGVDGLVTAYQQCLLQIQLYGPTNFAPVINHVANFALAAHKQASPDNYFILLMLTDGVVTDMPETCRAIVRASHLPMSIIIIGVGTADFSNMIFLDGDGDILQTPDGTKSRRDIVQFVPFYKYKDGDPALLAKEVLAEVPQQLTEYYRIHNILPKRPR